jgi:hypothetical protein
VAFAVERHDDVDREVLLAAQLEPAVQHRRQTRGRFWTAYSGGWRGTRHLE